MHALISECVGQGAGDTKPIHNEGCGRQNPFFSDGRCNPTPVARGERVSGKKREKKKVNLGDGFFGLVIVRHEWHARFDHKRMRRVPEGGFESSWTVRAA